METDPGDLCVRINSIFEILPWDKSCAQPLFAVRHTSSFLSDTFCYTCMDGVCIWNCTWHWVDLKACLPSGPFIQMLSETTFSFWDVQTNCIWNYTWLWGKHTTQLLNHNTTQLLNHAYLWAISTQVFMVLAPMIKFLHECLPMVQK